MSIDYDAHEALKRRAIPCQYPECHGHFCQGVECDGPPEMAVWSDEQEHVTAEKEAMWLLALIFVGGSAVVGLVMYVAYLLSDLVVMYLRSHV